MKIYEIKWKRIYKNENEKEKKRDPRGGESPVRPAEPQTDIVGPQRPRSEADEGVKGVMMVDLPPHQPHTKKKKAVTFLSEEVTP